MPDVEWPPGLHIASHMAFLKLIDKVNKIDINVSNYRGRISSFIDGITNDSDSHVRQPTTQYRSHIDRAN